MRRTAIVANKAAPTSQIQKRDCETRCQEDATSVAALSTVVTIADRGPIGGVARSSFTVVCGNRRGGVSSPAASSEGRRLFATLEGAGFASDRMVANESAKAAFQSTPTRG